MTDKMAIRTFPTAYKLKAIKRAEGGEGVLPVARKLGISRKLLHDWIKAWKAHGPAGPRKLRPLAEPAAKGVSGELAQARTKIAELERKIGQQALDIDFFHKALRALEAADRQGSIAPASRKSSKP
jgi:transposase-like protein